MDLGFTIKAVDKYGFNAKYFRNIAHVSQYMKVNPRTIIDVLQNVSGKMVTDFKDKEWQLFTISEKQDMSY